MTEKAAEKASEIGNTAEAIHAEIALSYEGDTAAFAKAELDEALGTDFDMSGFVDPVETIRDDDGTLRTETPPKDTGEDADAAKKAEEEAAAAEEAKKAEEEAAAKKAEEEAAAAAAEAGKTEDGTKAGDEPKEGDEPTPEQLQAQLDEAKRERDAYKAISQAQSGTIKNYETRLKDGGAAKTETKADAGDDAGKGTQERETALAEAGEALKTIEQDYGADFVKPFKIAIDTAKDVGEIKQALQHLGGVVETLAEGEAEESDEDIQAAIDGIPTLKSWQADAAAADAGVDGKSTSMWNAAVALNQALLEGNEWDGKPVAERMAFITKTLGGDVPATETKPSEDDPGAAAAKAAAEEAAAKAAQPQKKTDVDKALEEADKAPSSASALAGGTQGRQTQHKSLEDMSHLELEAEFEKLGSNDEVFDFIYQRMAA